MAQRFLQTVSGVVSTTLDERYPAAIDVSGVEIRDRDVRPPNVNAGRPEQTRFPPQPGGQVQVTGSVTVVTSQPPPSLHSGSQAQGDAGGQSSIAVGIGGPVRGAGSISSGNTEVSRQKSCQKPGNYCKKLLIITGISTAIIFLLLSIIIGTVKHASQQQQATDSSELLQSDTILGYRGTSPVQLTAQVESGKSSKFHVSLISINCEKLIVHESRNTSNVALNFLFEYPVKFPSGYYHYEMGSNFTYHASFLSNVSELIMRVFSNTVEADNYINDHTDQAAQKKAVFERTFNGIQPPPAIFTPSMASYYIPTFVAAAGVSVNVSYFIERKYYLITDYVTYMDHCTLNSTHSQCDIESGNGTEICVIVRYTPTSTTDAARIFLTASKKKDRNENILPLFVFYVCLCVSVGFAVSFVSIAFYFICKKRTRSRLSERPGFSYSTF